MMGLLPRPRVFVDELGLNEAEALVDIHADAFVRGWSAEDLAALMAGAGILIAALACITAASASRAVAVALAVVGPRTTNAGSGAWFTSRTGPASVAVSAVSAGLIAVVASIVAGTPALLVGAVVGAVAALLVSVWLARLRDGVDGDLLGAGIEIAFTLGLVVIVVAT